MGLFGILKKNKLRALDYKEIHMHELDNWLNNFTDSSGIDVKISILKRDISSKVIRLNELLNALETATLKDEKIIPERVKSIFEGNRRAFIDKIRTFILELKVPDEREDVDSFLEKVSEKLNLLSEETQKNYFVLREFVEDHIRPILAKIKDIDLLISNSRSELDKTPLSKIKEIRAHQKKYFFLIKEIESLNQELEQTLKLKESELERKAKFDSKLSQLRETKAYDEYKTLLNREIELNKNILNLEREIKQKFSELDYLLKKRSSETGNSLLERYSDNSVEAFLEDEENKILSELEHIKNNIQQYIIKKDKRELLISSIEQLSSDKLSEFRSRLVSLRDELGSVLGRLKENTYERSLREHGGWIDSINKNIEAIEKKQQDIEDLIERMDPKYVKQKIKDILKLLDIKVELK